MALSSQTLTRLLIALITIGMVNIIMGGIIISATYYNLGTVLQVAETLAVIQDKENANSRYMLNNISTEVRHHNADVREIIQKQLNLTLIGDTNRLLHDVMNLLGNRTATVTSTNSTK